MGFLLAQTVKNLPAIQKTWVQSLGWKDPLEEGKATQLSELSTAHTHVCVCVCVYIYIYKFYI